MESALVAGIEESFDCARAAVCLRWPVRWRRRWRIWYPGCGGSASSRSMMRRRACCCRSRRPRSTAGSRRTGPNWIHVGGLIPSPARCCRTRSRCPRGLSGTTPGPVLWRSIWSVMKAATAVASSVSPSISPTSRPGGPEPGRCVTRPRSGCSLTNQGRHCELPIPHLGNRF